MDQKIIEKLEAEFDEARVKTKKVPGRPDASYLEAYDVIDKANEVFGYGAWGTTIIDLDLHETGGKTACVVTLELSVDGCFSRQDVGVVIAAQSQGKELSPESLETAVKGAVSDALKRAMRHFGKQFGNSLYDKERNGQGAKQEKPQAKTGKGKVSSDPMSQLWDYAQAKGLKEGSVTDTLSKCEGDAEKALITLKELE